MTEILPRLSTKMVNDFLKNFYCHLLVKVMCGFSRIFKAILFFFRKSQHINKSVLKAEC